MGEGLKRARAAAKATRKPKAAPAAKPKPVAARLPRAEGVVFYVKAGVTPGWRDLWVYDLKAKKYVPDVAEANALEGWYDQAVRDASGALQRRGVGYAFRRVRGKIRIDRRG